MNDPIRIGFVGAGFMGQKAHLDCFTTIPGCQVVALAEGRQDSAQLVATRYGIPRTYPDHREMLRNEELDAVVAILPYSLHSSVIPDILDAGLHVLTEKPMCISPDTGRRMAKLARDRGVIYYVGYMKRSAPATRRAVDVISDWKASGAQGHMKYLRASMPPGDWLFEIEPPLSAGDGAPGYEGVAPEPFPSWMDELTGREYNSFINYFIHQVNLIRCLLGEDWQVEYVGPGRSMLAGTSSSGVEVVLEMAGYGLRTGWEEAYRMVFEQGKVELDIPSPMARQRGGEVRIFRGGDIQSEEIPCIPPRWPFLEQARHFVDCVRGEDSPRSVPEDAVKDLEVAEEYARLVSQ